METLTIRTGGVDLHGELALPACPGGVVVFAHGSASSRAVADALTGDGLATLRFVGSDEIERLSDQLVRAIEQVAHDDRISALPIGLFGASTAAAATLLAAARLPGVVSAVVSRGGRPDLADDDELAEIECPTLFVVGADDHDVLELNRAALARMTAPAELEVVPHATHCFDEPGAMPALIDAVAGWFRKHLIGGRARAEPHELWSH